MHHNINRKEDTVFCYYAHNSVWTFQLGYGADTMFHRTYFLFQDNFVANNSREFLRCWLVDGKTSSLERPALVIPDLNFLLDDLYEPGLSLREEGQLNES